MSDTDFKKIWPRAWIWVALGVLALGDAIWVAIIPERATLSWEFLIEIAGVLTLALVVLRHTESRRLYAVTMGLLFVILAWPSLRLYNHLTMTTGFPMQDELLARWDKELGLNWLSYVHALDGMHAFVRLLALCYSSLTTVSCAFFVVFVLANDLEAAEDFLILFFLSAVVISSIGALFPANGATVFYMPTKEQLEYIPTDVGTWFVAPLHEVRTDPAHVFDLRNMPGLTAFPSFHSAMGVLIIYCCRNRSYLILPGSTFVSLMIASAVIFGGHYFVDILAGIVTALLLIFALRSVRKSAKSANISTTFATAANRSLNAPSHADIPG